MNVLIDIGHPAHVHLYRALYNGLQEQGHKVIVTVKDIPSAQVLLEKYDIPYISLGKKQDSIGGKFINQFKYNIKLWKLARKYDIDFGIGSSITLAHVSKLHKMKSVIFDDDDDEVQAFFVKYAHPYCDVLLSPDVLRGKRKKKETLYYPSYHELAYLHPNRFQADSDVLKEAGLNIGERFFIMRFNAFKAHHDGGIRGLSTDQKLQLIDLLKPHGKILITTEREIEPELKPYQLKISPEKAHHLLAHASILIGDSQTMTSEAAVLGVPSLRCNSFAGRISYLEEEEEKYELTYGYLPSNFDQLVVKLKEWLVKKNLKEEWQQKRQQLLNDKIDLTQFMLWFIENGSHSSSLPHRQADFWQQFKQ